MGGIVIWPARAAVREDRRSCGYCLADGRQKPAQAAPAWRGRQIRCANATSNASARAASGATLRCGLRSLV